LWKNPPAARAKPLNRVLTSPHPWRVSSNQIRRRAANPHLPMTGMVMAGTVRYRDSSASSWAARSTMPDARFSDLENGQPLGA
jgi:hypothetical protein